MSFSLFDSQMKIPEGGGGGGAENGEATSAAARTTTVINSNTIESSFNQLNPSTQPKTSSIVNN